MNILQVTDDVKRYVGDQQRYIFDEFVVTFPHKRPILRDANLLSISEILFVYGCWFLYKELIFIYLDEEKSFYKLSSFLKENGDPLMYHFYKELVAIYKNSDYKDLRAVKRRTGFELYSCVFKEPPAFLNQEELNMVESITENVFLEIQNIIYKNIYGKTITQIISSNL